MTITMNEWVATELYTELINSPLWTLAAFGFLQSGDTLTKDDPRYALLTYLVLKHMNNVPSSVYDEDYRINWKPKDFVECIQGAVFQSQLTLKKISKTLRIV